MSCHLEVDVGEGAPCQGKVDAWLVECFSSGYVMCVHAVIIR